MECRTSGGKGGGFVNFKAKRLKVDRGGEDLEKEEHKTKSTSITIPDHLLKSMREKVLSKSQSQPAKPVAPKQDVKQLSSEVDKLKSQLAEMKRKRVMLQANRKS